MSGETLIHNNLTFMRGKMTMPPNSQSAGRGVLSGMPPLRKSRTHEPSGRITPDSETIVSSEEDEYEMSKSIPSLRSQPGTMKAPRRSSFLAELAPDAPRRSSFTAMSAASQTSQPPTPSGEPYNLQWSVTGNNLNRVTSNGSSSTFGPNPTIWGSQPPTSRLGQLATSPVTSHALAIGEEAISPISFGNFNDGSFPFSIPLQPTPKVYRSQSYSVGQMDNEPGSLVPPSRPRAPVTIKHRPSRLNEVEKAPTLDEVSELGDDESDQGVAIGSPGGRYSQAAESNALLRAAQENARAGQKTSPRSDRSSLQGARPQFGSFGQDEHQAVFGADNPNAYHRDSSDVLNNQNHAAQQQAFGRPYWQTELGFDQIEEPPQSRRHSLADVPTRRGSLAGNAQPFSTVAAAYANVPEHEAVHDPAYQRAANDIEATMVQTDAHNRAYASSYFSGAAPAMRSRLESNETAQSYSNMNTGFRQPGPGGLFQRPGMDTPLFIVAFKCARADVYYVTPGTGLQVNVGDLVIVEADRGFDLGTVTHANVSWEKAKELKDQAADEHYRWLMMFSQHNQQMGTPNAAAAAGAAGRGMMADNGAPQRRRGMSMNLFEPGGSHDLRPRMIKRMAWPYEIAGLRDKEGNEAKAKRMCQQKANEHRCKMEILDAEFQIDWKKLTFYFFAEEYVNFNPLITELYKLYKVRIWMSAINPESYPSPSNKPPSGVGPGAVEGRDSPMDPRGGSQFYQQQQQQQQQAGSMPQYNDPDPFGRVPPFQNPYSNASYEYALANNSQHAQQTSQNTMVAAAQPFVPSMSPVWGSQTHNQNYTNHTNQSSFGGQQRPFGPFPGLANVTSPSPHQGRPSGSGGQTRPAQRPRPAPIAPPTTSAAPPDMGQLPAGFLSGLQQFSIDK